LLTVVAATLVIVIGLVGGCAGKLVTARLIEVAMVNAACPLIPIDIIDWPVKFKVRSRLLDDMGINS
jgi:hypothetical protein